MKQKDKTKSQNYLDDQEFYNALVKRKVQVQEALAAGKPKPVASDFIGKCILLICDRMGSRYNFASYSYISLMISKGIEDCVAAIDYFDTDKYDKPFSYFSRVAWRAFVRVIGEEHKQQYIKQKHFVENSFQHILLDNNLDNHQINVICEDLEASSQIIDKFENDLLMKKKEKEKKEAKGLAKFIDEE